MQKRPQLFILPILALAFAAMSGGLRPAVLGTLKDPRDGKTYKTTMIGKKEWMAQNLNYQMEGSFAINNNETLSEKMGRLYTWKAVESKNLCPKGWHVPTGKEWQEALKTLKLKPYKKDVEDTPPTEFYKEAVPLFEKIEFTDKSSFAGIYHDITSEPEFKYTNNLGMFWTSTPAPKALGRNTAIVITFYNEEYEGEKGVVIYGTNFRDNLAMSCRCVKD